MISLDVSLEIKVNFGQNNFLFNLRKYSNDNKILSCKNIFFNNYSVVPYLIKPYNFTNSIIIDKKELPNNIIPLFDSLGILTNNTYNLEPENLDIHQQLALINNFTKNFIIENKFDFKPFFNFL